MPGTDKFKPGFRLSEIDVGVIILGLVVSPLLGKLFNQLGVATLFTVFHFFLFCNVLRMHRAFELAWAASFVGLWLCSHIFGVPTWSQTYLLAFGLTVAATIAQLLLPSYHGVCWNVLNPKLPQWWEERVRGKT